MGLLLVGCGIAVGIHVLPHATIFDAVVMHRGGAQGEPFIQFIDFPLVFLAFYAFSAVWAGRERLPRWTGIDTLVALFFLFSIFSLSAASRPEFSFWEIVRYAKYALLYCTLRMLLNRFDIARIIVGGFIAMLLVDSIVGLAQYFFDFQMPIPIGDGSFPHEEVYSGINLVRTTGLIGHYNTYAAWLLCPLAFALGMQFTKINLGYKIIGLIAFFVGFAALFTTFSRNGWIAFVLCCMTVLIVAAVTKRIKMSMLLLVAAVGAVAIALVVSSNLFQMTYLRFFVDDGSAAQGRIDLMKAAMNMITAHPFTGIGLNNFDFVLQNYDATGISRTFNMPVHNMYLLVASETGLASAFLFTGIGIFLLRKCILILRSPTNDIVFLSACAVSATLVSLAVNSLLDVAIRHELVMAQLTVCAALIMHFSEKREMHDEKNIRADFQK